MDERYVAVNQVIKVWNIHRFEVESNLFLKKLKEKNETWHLADFRFNDTYVIAVFEDIPEDEDIS